MQYSVGFVFPGNAETAIKCSEKLYSRLIDSCLNYSPSSQK